MRSLTLSTLIRDRRASGFSSMPTPPTAAPLVFLVAEHVISCQPFPTVCCFVATSVCTIRCSCMQTTLRPYFWERPVSSKRFLSLLRVLTFIVDTFVTVLQATSRVLTPFSAVSTGFVPVAKFSIPTWFLVGGRAPCLSARRAMRHKSLLVVLFIGLDYSSARIPPTVATHVGV